MAAPLVQQVVIDQATAQRQLAELERELARLNNPVNIPVDVDAGGSVDQLTRDVSQADSSFENLNREIDDTDRLLRDVDQQADRTGRELETVGRRGASAFKGLASSAVGFIGAFAAFQGFQALGRGAFEAIQQASNLEESLSKTNVVFGEFAGNITDFAKTAPQALGLSNQAALEATATFGNLFTALGLTRQEAANLSPDIVQLAADLASFNNISVDDAITALRSGLVGEVEPLRRLGVAINAAVVEAKALELGLVGTSGEVSEAAKVQARYALILEQTVNAQGDFARTADGIANRQRTLAAAFQDLQAEIGVALLPAFEALLEQAPQIIEAVRDMVPAIAALAQQIGDTDFTSFITSLADVARGLAGIPALLGAFNLNPFDTGFEDLTATASLMQGFIELLREGEDPALALANSLVQLTTKGLDTDVLAEAAADMTKIADLKPQRAIDLIQQLRAAGPGLNITEQELNAVLAALERIPREAVLSQVLSRDELEEDARVATNAFGLITGSIDSLQNTFSVLDEFRNQVNSIQFEQLAEDIAESATQFTAFGDSLSAAEEALRDSENNIVTDFGEFFDNLQTELAARTAFQDNLLLLRAMGLDDLADTFQSLGLESAAALADAISDPSAAAEAEAFLEQQAQDNARAYNEAFRTELAQLLIQQPVDVILGQIQIPAIQATLGIAPIGGGQGVGDIIINQTFESEPVPTVNTQRAAQEINNIVRGGRG